jgi:hypothetical protein
MEKFFSWMLDGGEAWAKIFTILTFIVVAFIIFREIITWYYKINRIVELLESIDRKLSMTPQAAPSYSTTSSSISTDISNQLITNNQKVEDKADENINLKAGVNEKSNDNSELSLTERIDKVLDKEYNIENIFSTKKGKHDKK